MDDEALAFFASEFYDENKKKQFNYITCRKEIKKNSRRGKRSRSGESSCTLLRPVT